jgi:hypothetical protein
VTSVEDDRDVGVAHLIGKVAQLAAHGFYAEVGLARDNLEPSLAQHIRYCRGVMGRVGELRYFCICAAADDEGDALIGGSGVADQCHQYG